MFCLLGVLSVNHVSAQEEASGGAKLKNENDYFMREENVIKNLKKKRNQLSQSQKKDLDAKIKILSEENSSLKVKGNDATGKYDVTIKELCQALNDHQNHHLYW